MPDQLDIVHGLMKQQRFTEALPMLLQLTESNPSDWNLFYLLGQCYKFTNNYPGAVLALKRSAILILMNLKYSLHLESQIS